MGFFVVVSYTTRTALISAQFYSKNFRVLASRDSPSAVPDDSIHPPGREMQTVFVIDTDSDHRQKVKRLLDAQGYKVVLLENREQFLSRRKPGSGSCVLAEVVHCVNEEGIGFLDELAGRGWRIPVVFMKSACTVPQVVHVMRAGADGFICKQSGPKELLDSVQRALESAAQLEEADHEKEGMVSKLELLTKREAEVVKGVAQGLLNKEIAAQLGLALITVKTHRGNAMRKLEAGNAAELARIALMAGLVDPHHNGVSNGTAKKLSNGTAKKLSNGTAKKLSNGTAKKPGNGTSKVRPGQTPNESARKRGHS